MKYLEQCKYEIEWYEKHGKYPERIKTGRIGTSTYRFVQSDYIWNFHHPDEQEVIRLPMADYVAEQVTGIKTL